MLLIIRSIQNLQIINRSHRQDNLQKMNRGLIFLKLAYKYGFQFQIIFKMEQRLIKSVQDLDGFAIDNNLARMNQIRPLLYLVIFSILGMTIRTLLSTIFQNWKITSDYTALFVDLPSNFLGCFIMGLYIPSKNIWNTISPSLSLGIGTGLCGCITTWSGWNLSITKLFMMGNNSELTIDMQHIGVGSNIGSAFFAIGIGICIAQSGFTLGKYYNTLLMGKFNNKRKLNPLEGKISFFFALMLVLCIYSIGIFIIVLLQSYNKNGQSKMIYQQYYLISLLLSPFGALIRWQLGANLNDRGWLPFGTFSANLLGVLLDAISCGIFAREYGPGTKKHLIGFQPDWNYFQNIIMVAFCGNLTTVSTWINELNSFQSQWKSQVYAILLFLMSQTVSTAFYGCIYIIDNNNF